MCISSYRCTSYLILVIFILLKRSDPTKSVISLLRHLILEHLIPPKTSYKLIPPLRVSSSSHRWASHFIEHITCTRYTSGLMFLVDSEVTSNLVSTSLNGYVIWAAEPFGSTGPSRSLLRPILARPAYRLAPARYSTVVLVPFRLSRSPCTVVWSLRRPVFIRRLRLR